MKHIAACLVCMVFIPVLLAGHVDECDDGIRIITIEPALIEAALEGYMPVPMGPLIPANIVGIRMVSANEITLTVRNYLAASALEVQAILDIDGSEVERVVCTIEQEEEITVLYELPFFLTGEHKITASIIMEKPDRLSGWEENLVFGRRESSKTVNVLDVQRIERVDFEVEIDGNLSDWEGRPYVFIGRAEDVYPESGRQLWNGPEDLSARIYLGWDSDNIYIAAYVIDDKHYNRNKGARIWDGDAFQFAFAPSVKEMQPSNLGLALADEGLQAQRWEGEEGLWGKSRYAVVRDEANSSTFYEAAIPLEAMGIAGKKGTVFGFNAVVFEDDDGSGYDYWLQITPGIAGGQDFEAFKRFMLWD